MNKETFEGKWIALDGIDAVGKTTQVKKLSEIFHAQGQSTIILPEFSESPIGTTIRKILQEQRFYALHPDRNTPFADTLTLLADVCFQIEGRVKDALASGITVLSDRGLLSLMAYQWVRIEKYAGSEPFKSYKNFRTRVLQLLEGFSMPDVHIHLTIDDQTLQKRVVNRGEQPLTIEDLSFLQTVKKHMHDTEAEFKGIEVGVSQTNVEETSVRIVDAAQKVLNQLTQKEC